jgi:hypothetical protein|nr:MAG TPA: hypothetical protein [Caudoviricetes sp.]
MSYYRRRFPINTWEKEYMVLENKFDRAMTVANIIALEHEQVMRDIENKIFIENGSMEDMEYLYLEAENENSDKEKGILHKIIKFIKNIITKIGNKINELFSGGEDKEIKVDKTQLGFIDKVVNHFSEIKAAFNMVISGNVTGGCEKIMQTCKIEFSVAVASAALIGIRKSKLKQKYDFLHKLNDLANQASGKIDTWLDKETDNKGFDMVKSCIKFIKDEILKHLWDMVVIAGKWLNGEASGEDQSKKPKEGEGDNTDGDTPKEGDGKDGDTPKDGDNKGDTPKENEDKKDEDKQVGESTFGFWDRDEYDDYYESDYSDFY